MRNSLLASCQGNPLTASLFCGYIFEPCGVEVPEKKGGKFKCRRLVHGTAKEKKTGETKLVVLVAPSSVIRITTLSP